jgi:signal transduction histidine kinase
MGSHSLGHVFFKSNANLNIKSPEEVTAQVRTFYRNALIPFLVAISYYAGTRIGFFFTPANTPISTFWPPNALLLTAFLLTRRRMWWVLLLAVLPAHLLAQLHAGVPVARALGWFVGNTGEALLGAICIGHFRKQNRLFGSVRGLVIFLTFGVLVAPLTTSFFDAAVVYLTGHGGDYWMLWLTRLSSNMVANMTIVPTVLFFLRHGKARVLHATIERWVEAGVLVFGVVFVSVLMFHRVSWAGSPISVLILFAPLPFLLWAAVRFDSGGFSASMLLVAFIGCWNAVHGRGLSTSTTSATQNVLYLNILLSLFAVPLMMLAAVIADRRRAEGLLKNTRNKLIYEQEQERYRLARELHDDLAQRLILLGLELDQIGTELDPSMRERVQMLHDQLASISNATRDLSHELHPFVLEYIGLVGALRTLCRRASEHGKMKVTFNEQNVPPRLDVGIAHCLYRVAQEALQQVTDRGKARAVTVELKVEKGFARLLIFDDEIGLGSEQFYSGSTGLASARERLLDMDGTFNVTSTPQVGSRIEASLPLTFLNSPATAGQSIRSEKTI